MFDSTTPHAILYMKENPKKLPLLMEKETL